MIIFSSAIHNFGPNSELYGPFGLRRFTGATQIVLSCAFTLMLAFIPPPVVTFAQTPKTIAAQRISIDSKDSEATPGYIIYHDATVTTADGNTLTADELKADKGEGNSLKKATATGHVKAQINDAQNKGTYTITSDTGVYDPIANTVELDGNVKSITNSLPSDTTDASSKKPYTVTATAEHAVYDVAAQMISLTGNVKTVIDNSNTDGPIVQTGTSAVITFGKGPDYPKIDMSQVHTELTMKQQ